MTFSSLHRLRVRARFTSRSGLGIRLLLAAALGYAAILAQAAGFAFIEVPADKKGPALRGAVWSPCSTPPGRIDLAPLVLQGTRDCAVAGQGLPLVVVSHGAGGSALGHHDTAAALADAGYVVAAINHPGDNFQDLSRQGHLSAFATRPVDMSRLTDYMLGTWPQRAQLDAGKVGFFGYSRGGYTGLVAIGAKPDWTLRPDLCPPLSMRPLCGEIRRNEIPATPAPDARIRAAVIVDPLSVFDAKGLGQVGVPVQLWASALGGSGVTLQSVEVLRQGLPRAPDWHVAANAEHYAFLAPCPPALAEVAPEICRDAPGFDRVAFHQGFNAKVVGFFQQHLAAGKAP
ncbi:dienelactone hydrolase [Acidovorax sp. HMWF029]|uniref:alpha/beta hydrolase family protein n=1 Tax=Acidovorax sp. HMWF029 TaxID=2056863 RepID=UPI000D3D90D6|nr:alpha/beta hydrolase [Acidovorax sp. HMWF029]PTT19952.1 dienelactone hydrolase [Acidovorax sp. HMWF029]